jgi:hypothetical protein
MSTIYVTADELIVVTIAVSIALVPLIMWRGRRASRIRVEARANEQSFATELARRYVARWNPFHRKREGKIPSRRAG